MKKHNFISITLMVLFFIVLGQLSGSNTAFGLNLIGPPRSILQQGENALSLELEYSETDLKTFGDVTESWVDISYDESSYNQYKIEKLKSTMPSVRIDTSLLENWDLFIRIGASDAKDEITQDTSDDSTGRQYLDFDGKFGFSYGVGTRATFYKDNNTSWGSVFQINWMNPGKSDITDSSDPNFTGEAELDYWEFQFAFGPTIELDSIRIYGGPFVDFIIGDLDFWGSTVDPTPPNLEINVKSSHEVREKSQFGGFLGAQWKVGDYGSLITETQFTGDAWGIGVSTMWKF